MDAFALALENILNLQVLTMLCAGVVAGLLLGVVPGVNGLLGLVVFAPLTMGMDIYAALALILGLLAVTTTSDTIPAVLIGVPGTGGAITTVVDGHPMAKNGEAARALAAAYLSSAIGGIFGATVLLLSIPVMAPLLLSLRSSDFFAISLLGLFFVAAVSGESRIKGIAAAALGLLLAQVGLHPVTGEERFTFGLAYFWSGLALPLVLLGVFALPMLAQLSSQRRVAENVHKNLPLEDMRRGFRDVVREWQLILRCSALGAVLGAVPGVGVIVIDWIAYGLASRDRRSGPAFGTGNVRGVIAPESANNAKDGGALIPTIAFGLPGSAGMVILLGVLSMQGVSPGGGLLEADLSLTIAMVFILVLANILGVLICLAVTPQLARVARLQVHLLLPIAVLMVTVSAFQVTLSIADIATLLGAGFLGLVLGRSGYSRPAFALAFVLGMPVERYFSLAWQIEGPSLLLRPSILIVFVVGGLLMALSGRFNTKGMEASFRASGPLEGALVAATLALTGGLFAIDAWRIGGPTWVLSVGVGLALICTASLAVLTGHLERGSLGHSATLSAASLRPALRIFVLVGLITLGLYAFGIVPTAFLTVIGYAFSAVGRVGRSELLLAVALAFICRFLFIDLANVAFPEPWIMDTFPAVMRERIF